MTILRGCYLAAIANAYDGQYVLIFFRIYQRLSVRQNEPHLNISLGKVISLKSIKHCADCKVRHISYYPYLMLLDGYSHGRLHSPSLLSLLCVILNILESGAIS